MFPAKIVSRLLRPPAGRWLPPARAACWLLLAAGLGLGRLDGAVPTEYEVKAAFLFNFTKFVDWPVERFAGPEAPLVIAVLGRNPFGEELANLVRGRLVNGRPLDVRFLATAADLKAHGKACHVLFVAAGEEASFAEAPPPSAVLTVGESDRFAALGGIVRFFVVENRIRFEINRAAAEAAGLRLRAQLQKLAAPARPPAEGTRP